MRQSCAAVALLSAFISCAPSKPPEDGFRKRLALSCESEEPSALKKEAQLRANRCQEEGLDCADVARDYWDAVARKGRCDDDAARKGAEQRSVERARAAEAAADDRRRRSAEREAASRANIMETGIIRAVQACTHTGELHHCAFDGADDEARARCEATCTTNGSRRADETYLTAVQICLDGFEAGEGAHCSFQTRSGATIAGAPVERLKECEKRCEEVGRLRRSWAAQHARCCDGTRSPSCLNRTFHQGCCSHHGGGCLEPEPSP